MLLQSAVRYSPSRSKRIVVLATAVGILLVGLTGGGAMALTGIAPRDVFQRAAERSQGDQDTRAQSPEVQKGLVADDEDADETTSPTQSSFPVTNEGNAAPGGQNEPPSETLEPSSSTVEVPDLIGRGRSEASSELAAAGLKLGNQKEAPDKDVPKDEITGQDPEVGTEVEQGGEVDVTISSGPPKPIAVPNIINRNIEEAKTTMDSLGIGYTVITAQSIQPAGTVVSTGPPAGTVLDQSKTVTIKQSAGPPNPSQPSATSSKQSPAPPVKQTSTSSPKQ